jgi:hypothetical protein
LLFTSTSMLLTKNNDGATCLILGLGGSLLPRPWLARRLRRAAAAPLWRQRTLACVGLGGQATSSNARQPGKLPIVQPMIQWCFTLRCASLSSSFHSGRFLARDSACRCQGRQLQRLRTVLSHGESTSYSTWDYDYLDHFLCVAPVCAKFGNSCNHGTTPSACLQALAVAGLARAACNAKDSPQ